MRRLLFVLLALGCAAAVMAYSITYSSGATGISVTDANTLTTFTNNHSGGDSAPFPATWVTIRPRTGSNACFYDFDGVATTADTRLGAGEFSNERFIPSPTNSEGWFSIGAICDTGETATWDVKAGR
jgi:hypothetical protein